MGIDVGSLIPWGANLIKLKIKKKSTLPVALFQLYTFRESQRSGMKQDHVQN